MKLQYDHKRDLLYVLFDSGETHAAKTATISPGVFADVNSQEHLIGIEVVEASKIIGKGIEFSLPELYVTTEAA